MGLISRTEREAALIARTGERPLTVPRLVADLHALGVEAGMNVLVHTALSALGWVAGGPVAVVLALEQAIGDSGTLMMPAFSMLGDPAAWANPPAPPAWWDDIRMLSPPYDRSMTPSRAIGAVAECFRSQQGTRRSDNPWLSFVARGPLADEFLDADVPSPDLDEASPLARLYARDGHVLLLGVEHGNNSSLHLAEYRAQWPGKRLTTVGRTVAVDGRWEWNEVPCLDIDADDFSRLGSDYERETDAVRRGRVGVGTGRLMRQRALVDWAVGWFEHHRD